MYKDLRTRLLLSQGLTLAGIMLIVTLLLWQLLARSLISNLDQFLHQQADNFKATIVVSDSTISFCDLNPEFVHSKRIEDEIPFYMQLLDTNYQTIMLSGSLKGQALHPEGKFPLHEIQRTVRHGEDRLRQLITPVTYAGKRAGWLIVSVFYYYLDNFRHRLFSALTLITGLTLVFLIIINVVFIRWSLKPVQDLAEQVNERASNNILDPLPVPNSADEFAYLTKTFNNLLKTAKTSLAEVERFSGDASHELKTPLAVIRTKLIKLDRDHTPEQSDALTAIHQEVVRMQQTIDNLLILSQANLKYTLKNEVVWLNDFIADSISRIEHIYRSKKINYDLSEVASLKINTDLYLLYLVFNNLLKNAVLYSPPGSTIHILASAEEQPGHIVIRISDKGPGVPEEKIARLFTRFYRLDSSRSRGSGGSGLGLSIARWAADMLNGQLKLKNAEPVGLIATLRLPAEPDPKYES